MAAFSTTPDISPHAGNAARTALKQLAGRLFSRETLRRRRLVAAYPAYFVLSEERSDRRTQER